MSTIDLDTLLTSLSDEAPCGEDLEYDAEFGELERAAERKPEQQIGDTIVEAEEPDWRAVEKQALALFSRTKDLRVTIHLVRALLGTEGYVGLREGLALLRGLIEGYWEGVHPLLDPDDDNDPTLRVNTIAELCDSAAFLNPTKKAPLVISRALGRFGLRDLDYANGAIPWPEGAEGAAPDLASIDAAFMDVELDVLTETTEATHEAGELLGAIETYITEQIGVGQAPSLGALREVLKEAHGILAEHLQRRGVGDGSAAEDEDGEQVDGEGAPVAGKRISGEVRGREDVLRTLDLVIAYYRREEPSSPVPLLIERAKRMVPMNFMDIVRDMAPDGVTQVETVVGATEEDEE